MRKLAISLSAAAAVGVIGFAQFARAAKPVGPTVQHAGKPAAATPALTPDEQVKHFRVPEGFEVRLFAADPDVINPVTMTWDERGRLWVLELYEYPMGAPKGAKPRDRIKILEDTDGDGRADKVTIFADGLNLATGLVLGDGGAYVGAAPDFMFLKDTDGDGVADKRTVLRTGFGRHDTHELLNGFTWGPDGWLYMTHGVFTHSYVKDPDDPNDDGVTVNAAVARWHPTRKKFEIFADGMSNQWGLDFDAAGNAFCSACVIDHLFHVVPGGIYVRQAGTPGFNYAYEQLKSIVDHKHFMAAYCGVQVYQGDAYPAEYAGNVLMGNIHGNSINRDRLVPNGSSFKASDAGDLLVCDDGWFRPTSTQVGPDGCVWIADWYDRYPCYQNAKADPEGVDRKHGRIWRVVHTGKDKGKKVPSVPAGMGDLSKKTDAELVGLLSHANAWQRRTAQRLLSERGNEKIAPGLIELLTGAGSRDARLAALWSIWGSGHFAQLYNSGLADKLIVDKEPAVRAWMARFIRETGRTGGAEFKHLSALAADADATVRYATAWAARRFPADEAATIVSTLVRQPHTASDPMLPFAIWMAAEPIAASQPKVLLDELAKVETEHAAATDPVIRKTMRRIWDAGKPEIRDFAVHYLEKASGSRAAAAIDGMLDGQKQGAAPPTVPTAAMFTHLLAGSDKALIDRAHRLGALWGDLPSTTAVLANIGDAKVGRRERLESIGVAHQLKTDAARDVLLAALAKETHGDLLVEMLRAIGACKGDGIPAAILARYSSLPEPARRAAIDVLSARQTWAGKLLDAVQDKTVAGADVSVSAMRTMSTFDEPAFKKRLADVLGRFRETNAERAKMIADKKHAVLNGPVDFALGEALATKHCLVCHKLNGKGATVGPDLTGVGRSTIDALLANMLDPNQVIGKGYEQVNVLTKDERILAGRLIEDTPKYVKLLSAGPKEEVIAKEDIASLKVTDLSVMPEGIEKQMTDAEMRQLVWFVFNPPAEHDRLLRVFLREDGLSVFGKLPGRPAPVELIRVAASADAKLALRSAAGAALLSADDGLLPHVDKIDGKPATPKFIKVGDLSMEKDRVAWRAIIEWKVDGATAVIEERTVAVHATTGDEYRIDVESALRSASGKSVKVAGGGVMLHSIGRGLSYRNIGKSPWATVTGQSFAVGLLDHPANPRHPPVWTSKAGVLSSADPAEFTLDPKKGESVLRTRVLVGTALPPDRMKRELDEFSAVGAVVKPTK